MKGYWYVPAVAGISSVFTKIFDSVLFSAIFLIWLFFLYSTKRLGKFPFFISLTIFLFYYSYIPPIVLGPQGITEEHMVLQGEIISPIQTSDEVLQFDFRDNQSNHKIKVIHFNPDINQEEFLAIKYGAVCQLAGLVSNPSGGTNPGQFDYQKYLAASGIHYDLMIETMDNIVCHGSKGHSFLHQIRWSMKQYIIKVYSEETSVWINALVLGDDSRMPDEVTELFQRWGISHILAISGLHIGLVVGLLYFVTVKINLLTKEKAQFIMIFFLPIYAVLAGGEPSVLRASIMVLMVIFIQKLRLRFSPTDIISITFLILLLVDKYIIYHIGFQLSFIVSFGIILSKSWLLDSDSLLFQMLKLSFISQLIIVPLQIIYFYNLNPLSIVLNVIVVPYFSFFVIPFMFFLVVVSPSSHIRELLDYLFKTIHDYLFLKPLEIIDQIAYFPWLTGHFPGFLIAIYYTLLIAMMSKIQNKKNKQAFFYGITLTFILFSLVARPYVSPYGSVTMLDIGQGDAFVIELPFRRGIVLIDAGANFSFDDLEPSDSVYKKILKPFFHYQGIREIDAIIITHEDIDHAGSVEFIIKEFNVEKVIVSDFFKFNSKLKESLGRERIEILTVKDGQHLNLKGKMFTILSPRVDKKSNNENSIVLLTEFGNRSWLFTGDIHRNIEQEIMHHYPDISADVIKIAHHGSNTSTDSEFINQINPTYALISVGRKNRYGHPTSDVIELLENEGITILRTDLDGAIIYRFTEKNGTFYQFRP